MFEPTKSDLSSFMNLNYNLYSSEAIASQSFFVLIFSFYKRNICHQKNSIIYFFVLMATHLLVAMRETNSFSLSFISHSLQWKKNLLLVSSWKFYFKVTEFLRWFRFYWVDEVHFELPVLWIIKEKFCTKPRVGCQFLSMNV